MSSSSISIIGSCGYPCQFVMINSPTFLSLTLPPFTSLSFRDSSFCLPPAPMTRMRLWNSMKQPESLPKPGFESTSSYFYNPLLQCHTFHGTDVTIPSLYCLHAESKLLLATTATCLKSTLAGSFLLHARQLE